MSSLAVTRPAIAQPAYRQYATSTGQSNGSSSGEVGQTAGMSNGVSNGHATTGGTASANLDASGFPKDGKINLGLERMYKLMSRLPPLRVPAIHLAGTNGKGSVSAMLDSCLRASGLRVARYNSPHLVEVRRGIALDGQYPTREEYAEVMERVQAVNVLLDVKAEPFELATAVAYYIINRYNPDIMIIECGMGGETDATNVIPSELIMASGLTAVGLDHTEYLGDTPAKITEIKARIAVRDGLLVVGPQRFDEVIPTARRIAEERGARLVEANRSVRSGPGKLLVDLNDFHQPPAMEISTHLAGKDFVTKLSLAGEHQLFNASLAITILFVIRADKRAMRIQPKLEGLNAGAVARGMETAAWPGRCSWVTMPDDRSRRPILVDGAHNADSALTLRKYVDSLETGTNKRTWIMSISQSKAKTPESVLEPLLSKGDDVIFVGFATPIESLPWIKPSPLEPLADIARRYVGDGSVKIERGGIEPAVRSAIGNLQSGLIVVCGSLYLVSDLYKLLETASASAKASAQAATTSLSTSA